MEQEKDMQEEYVKRLVEPIFKAKMGKSPQEAQRNTMSVGVSTGNEAIVFYWRPNNYRLKFPFSRSDLHSEVTSTLNRSQKRGCVVVTKHGHNLKISNYGSKITCKINGIPLMIDKKSITATYSLRQSISATRDSKAYYKIEAASTGQVWARMQERIQAIEKMCIEAVKKFIKLYGGYADFGNITHLRYEDALHIQDWLPDVPEDMIIHDTHFKKVYPKDMEFKNPLYLKNFVSNMCLKEIAPEIVSELNRANLETEKLTRVAETIVKLQSGNQSHMNEVLIKLSDQIDAHLALIQEYRQEALEWKKPFFIRWYEYLTKSR